MKTEHFLKSLYQDAKEKVWQEILWRYVQSQKFINSEIFFC